MAFVFFFSRNTAPLFKRYLLSEIVCAMLMKFCSNKKNNIKISITFLNSMFKYISAHFAGLKTKEMSKLYFCINSFLFFYAV